MSKKLKEKNTALRAYAARLSEIMADISMENEKLIAENAGLNTSMREYEMLIVRQALDLRGKP